MPKNKITWKWNEQGTGIDVTGSIRQPTLTEINNYALEEDLQLRTLLQGCWIVGANFGEGYKPVEEDTTITLYEWGPERCPVCGHEYEIANKCPICGRRFDE